MVSGATCTDVSDVDVVVEAACMVVEYGANPPDMVDTHGPNANYDYVSLCASGCVRKDVGSKCEDTPS